MGARVDELLKSAEELLRERRFGEAIEAFHLHLEEEPRDVKALLELGICHLLNGSRQAFLRIYEEASRFLKGARKLPGDVARLWKQYRGLFRKVTAAALVVGSVALATTDVRASGAVIHGPVRPAVAKLTISLAADGWVIIPPERRLTVEQFPRFLSLTKRTAGRVALTIRAHGKELHGNIGKILDACFAGKLGTVSIVNVDAAEQPVATSRKQVIRVSVYGNRVIRVGGKTCTPEALQGRLTEAQKTAVVSVVVQADAKSSFPLAVKVLGACRAANVKNVSFAVPRVVTSSHRYSAGVQVRPRPQKVQ